MRSRPFSKAALIAEFHRIKGSGRAEDALRDPQMRLQLVASLRQHLQATRRTQRRPSPAPAMDIKRLQANDLD